jgi:glycosyltransferase involved in cell wall biosynthesis
MRILIISDVPWRDDNSVGNTYSNIFKNTKGVEFANLYCKSGNPDTNIVKIHFQITEKKMLSKLIGKKHKEDILSASNIEVFNRREQKIYDIVRTLRFQSFFLIRELIWKIGRWKTKELNDFLNDFRPDVIFSFCLDSLYYSNLIEYCKSYTSAKLVLFFADDVYAYIKRDPLYLIYKYNVRKRIEKTANISDLIYGATPQLCDEYSLLFQKNITPLYKICEEVSQNKLEISKPLKITYTGNLFYGRWKTLALIAQAIKEINADSIKVQLDIYTTGLTTKQMDAALNIIGSSRLAGAIPYEQVKDVLKSSDIVLHAESFEKKEIKKTRLSFSTKIVDCMQSGSCLLAVGPEETASIRLLKDYNIALIVSVNNKAAIKDCLLKILEDNNIITCTAQRMNQFAIEKHSLDTLAQNLYVPLENLLD